jgi:phenylalanine ammonia-lyase
MLSPATVPLYEAVREVVGRPPASDRPYIWDDRDQFLSEHIGLIAEDIGGGGRIAAAVEPVAAELA